MHFVNNVQHEVVTECGCSHDLIKLRRGESFRGDDDHSPLAFTDLFEQILPFPICTLDTVHIERNSCDAQASHLLNLL